MQYWKLFLVLVLSSILLLTGCKEKINTEYNRGYEEAQTAFQVEGNTQVDKSKSKDNLGLKVEERKGSKETQVSSVAQGSGDAQTDGERQAYKYVVNTETYMIYDIHAPQVDLRLPTNVIWKGTLEEAIAEGYTKDPDSLGY